MLEAQALGERMLACGRGRVVVLHVRSEALAVSQDRVIETVRADVRSGNLPAAAGRLLRQPSQRCACNACALQDLIL